MSGTRATTDQPLDVRAMAWVWYEAYLQYAFRVKALKIAFVLISVLLVLPVLLFMLRFPFNSFKILDGGLVLSDLWPRVLGRVPTTVIFSFSIGFLISKLGYPGRTTANRSYDNLIVQAGPLFPGGLPTEARDPNVWRVFAPDKIAYETRNEVVYMVELIAPNGLKASASRRGALASNNKNGQPCLLFSRRLPNQERFETIEPD